jgi:hypothetical protein
MDASQRMRIGERFETGREAYSAGLAAGNLPGRKALWLAN